MYISCIVLIRDSEHGLLALICVSYGAQFMVSIGPPLQLEHIPCEF